ncbi:cryptochrome/photolyase family protein [Nocardia sp. CA-290969]|uniref:cryptochrome/photolyase family protein n=1 Tax=Nocardia sp. CA-290969 TaxID=3239986 RepID=UPI003D930CED
MAGVTGPAVALFTRDLRVRDNPVLTAAHRAGGTVVPLFVLDEAILARRECPPNRAHFLATALSELDTELRALGGRLVVRSGDVAGQVARVAAETGAATVHIAADVSAYSRGREERLRQRLARDRRDLCVHQHSVTVLAPGESTPAGRDHFAVFTPYFRRWTAAQRRAPLRAPHHLELPAIDSGTLPRPGDLASGDRSPDLSVGGETTGRKMLRTWLSRGVTEYARDSDDLAADATSHLSPYLHFGCLSPADLVRRTDESTAGGAAFLRQLAWRDFHHQVLAARPRAAWHDYRDREIRWRTDEQAVRAWSEGRTGYPIVDAGMRQLHAQGWMPNRARLIAASFLTKTLRVDWRIGARHFLYWLVDADLANNQLNWQWVAGTGNDTRPNRVLNPLRQAERYDPDGTYVRRWIPELAHLEGRAVHRPWRSPVENYPAPIIECPGM